MATGQRKASSSRRPAQGGRKPASSKGRSSRSVSQVPEQSTWQKFASSRMAMPLIAIAVVLVIVGVDLLISWNDFSGFFKILGIELLVAVVIWILKLVFSKSKSSDEADVTEV